MKIIPIKKPKEEAHIPPKKIDPVQETTNVLLPVAILVIVIAALFWGVSLVNEAINIELWSMGAGALIAIVALAFVVYKRFS